MTLLTRWFRLVAFESFSFARYATIATFRLLRFYSSMLFLGRGCRPRGGILFALLTCRRRRF